MSLRNSREHWGAVSQAFHKSLPVRTLFESPSVFGMDPADAQVDR